MCQSVKNNNSIETTTIENQFWTRTQIFVATLFGGPLSGCYLVARNFHALGDSDLEKKWYIGGAIFTILLVVSLYMIPQQYLNVIPGPVIPIAYTFGIHSYTKLQRNLIEQTTTDGITKYSWWKVLGIAIAGFVLTIILSTVIGVIFSSFITIKPL